MGNSGEFQVDWSISKCFRVLRPILSRKVSATSSVPTKARSGLGRQRDYEGNARRRIGDSPNSKLDPDWMAKSRKVGSKQYAKAIDLTSDALPEFTAGVFSIPTPFARKVFGATTENDPEIRGHKLDTLRGGDIFKERFVPKTDHVKFRSQKLVQGTLDLIESTNTCADTKTQKLFFPTQGARSLRAMCCKRFARYVVELEHDQERETCDEKFDIALEAFELLEETLGNGANEYLRAVTREYGIAKIEDSLAASQVQRSHSIALLRRMRTPQHSIAKHPSSGEVEAILRTLYRACTPDKRCCNQDNTFGNTFNIIGEISSLLAPEEQTAFEFRQFRELAQNAIPICWFGSRRLTALWMNIFHALCDGDQSIGSYDSAVRDIVAFVETAVSKDLGLTKQSETAMHLLSSTVVPDYQSNTSGCPSCPRPISATFLKTTSSQQPHSATQTRKNQRRLCSTLDNTFASLFAILVAFVLVLRDQLGHTNSIRCLRITSMIGELAVDIIQNLAMIESRMDEYPFKRCSYVLSAVLLLFVDPNLHKYAPMAIDMDDVVEALKLLDSQAQKQPSYSRGVLEHIPDFLYTTVRSAGKLLRTDGMETLEYCANLLAAATNPSNASHSTKVFLHDLVAASTALFYERTGSDRASDLMVMLEQDVHGCLRARSQATPFKPTPRSEPNRDGLKWDDGISEWIDSHILETSQPIELGLEANIVPKRQLQRKIEAQKVIQEHEKENRLAFDLAHYRHEGSDWIGNDFITTSEYSHECRISKVLLSLSSPVQHQSVFRNECKDKARALRPISDHANLGNYHPSVLTSHTDGYGKARTDIPRKRPITEVVEGESGHELWSPPSRKRVQSKNSDYHHLANEHEQTDSPEFIRGDLSRQAHRARRRGKHLRSVSGNLMKSRRSQGSVFDDNELAMSDDELAIACVHTATTIRCENT